MTNPHIPDHLPARVRARIVATRRAQAAEQGRPDPYPDEPTPESEETP